MFQQKLLKMSNINYDILYSFYLIFYKIFINKYIKLNILWNNYLNKVKK